MKNDICRSTSKTTSTTYWIVIVDLNRSHEIIVCAKWLKASDSCPSPLWEVDVVITYDCNLRLIRKGIIDCILFSSKKCTLYGV